MEVLKMRLKTLAAILGVFVLAGLSMLSLTVGTVQLLTSYMRLAYRATF